MKKNTSVKNQKGFAALEAVVFLTAFMIMAVYSIDFFTAIHTGVLGNIQSRAYLFETLRHRSDINFLRFERPNVDAQFANKEEGHERFHAITDEDLDASDDKKLPAVGRTLTSADNSEEDGNGTAVNSINNRERRVSNILVKSGYGICTDSQCRGDGG